MMTAMVRYLFCFLLSVCGMAFAATEISPKRPNIVVILADDMGWSDLGCYGSEIATPHIDSLAKQGMLATRCYTVPRCSPSRASLLTGMYPQSVGVGHLDKDLGRPGYRGHLHPAIPTLPELLRDKAGYRTYMSGKWHVGTGDGWYPWQRGFDRYRGLLSGANGYYTLDPGRKMAEDGRMLEAGDLPKDFFMTDDITGKAIEYLKDAAKTPDKPFFLYVAYTAPHTPLEAPKATVDKYIGSYARQGFAAVQNKRLARQKKLGLVRKDAAIPAERTLPAVCSKEDDVNMALYAAQIVEMDKGVGRLIAALKRQGQWNNTVVMFLSDNGATKEMPGRNYEPYPGHPRKASGYGKAWASVSNTPYKGYKIQTYEGGVAVPCIIRMPGMEQGALYHAPMHFMDIAPSILRWAGVQPEKPMDGMAEPWKKPGAKRTIFCEHEGNRMVMTPEYKLVYVKQKKAWELYAIDDRAELRDVAAGHKDVVDDLKKRYADWAATHQVDDKVKNYYP